MSTLNARWNASAIALLAALLTACGGGEKDSASNSAVTPVTPASPATTTPEPGAPTLTGNTATDGVNWFNYRRQQAGLTALARNSLIDTAALGHSSYMRANNVIAHEQTAGKTGFTGANLLARLTAARYTLTGSYAIGEVISAAGQTSGFYHAEELIGAIYHRFVIMEPVFREIGTGVATGSTYTYFTADFATNNGRGAGVARGSVATYPATGQTRVPLNFFSDTESPDPVPNQNEVGYPISVHANLGQNLLVNSFTVRPRGGADLAVRPLAHGGDSETPESAAAIIPLTVLKTNTIYDVSFVGTVDGVAVARNWSFTTK
ncbi:CAP domain-containing protein [Pseudoduganella namucuonensis]|uniref:Uncharacterized conserved protein YkwD, contains CAP (CSP/antigen 5/PR1) domain n=1 Tax=Pseudoduganella namucuonensis TaxID=1035707 RepID=A0A1I7M0U3_9BURK|nr:CAP domain-containing protein [Pseudoduganella namucuonensis]SFV15519.1 Uncharacterized conserved protein YkwD, contains CAP (CSP/antigen 5/PR1) domain [Pseudoduganella namucuonensis]